MEPITLGILYPALAIAIATARPKWDISSTKNDATSFIFSPNNFNSLESPKGVVQTERPVYETRILSIITHREQVLSEVYRYASLPNNWDGDGAASLSSELIVEAKDFIDKLPDNLPLPSPMLSSDGSLGFYWDLPEGYIDIEISQPGTISVYARSRISKHPEYYEDDLNWRNEPQNWIEKAFAMLTVS